MKLMIRKVIQTTLMACLFGCVAGSGYAQAGKPLYENNFEQIKVGEKPEDFLILDGAFAVQEGEGNKTLELPGAPLDTYGALFGPTLKNDISVTARIFGTKKGRRFPTFAVGLNGQSGYRLQVSPGKGELELYHGDDLVAHVPYEWKSGEWTWLKLQSRTSSEGCRLEGKAWTRGTTEPEKALISFEDKAKPAAGRSAIWGSPYATTPIQFDDLKVESLAP